MSHWLDRIVPTRPGVDDDPTPSESDAVDAHFTHLVALRDSSHLILAGRTQEGADSVGVVIFTAAAQAEAQRIAASDPACSR